MSPLVYLAKSVLSVYTRHLRIGHPHPNARNKVFQHCNIQLPNKDVSTFCNACCFTESHRLPSTDSTIVYHTPLELVFSDLWRASPMASSHGFFYYILLLMPSLGSVGYTI